MSCYLFRKILDNDTLALGQLSSAAVDSKDVANLIQHLAIAVHPVETILADVYLRATGGHQAPAEPLFSTDTPGP